MKEVCTKSAYVAPRLQPLGRVESVTAGGTTGKKTDAAFDAGDPFATVTFS